MSTLTAFAALALLPLLAACQDQAVSAIAKPERPVQVQRVAFQSENASREFVGVVRARYETDLGFRVAGKITERIVNVGDRVHAGDVIARLDTQDLQLQVASAEAEIAAATSNFAQASSDEVRFTSLKARGYAAVADYERKKSAKDEADGRLERARRALELARNQLAYAELQANADGVVTATLAEPGQVVAIGQAVARLAQRGEVEASSRCRRPGSARRGRRRRACGCGRARSAASRHTCANCRRRQTRRPAPMPRASRSRIPTKPSRSA
jgi:multidrug efflux pump subunit AcrA (membrane-fusion protein)